MSMLEGTEIRCSYGAVAAGPSEAARAGAEILERGGNAMDAAAAACLACAVTEPQAVDIGGYGLAAVVLEGGTGSVFSVDANAVAPAAARPTMYQTIPIGTGRPTVNELEFNCSVVDQANFYGPLSVTVPGFLGGVGAIWERWGSLKWRDILGPALTLVESGIPYAMIAKDVAFKREAILRYPASAEFLLPDGPDHITPEHSLWMRPDLVRTLERLATAGWRDFYQGKLAHTIADFVLSQGGILTREDMAAFNPRITEPLSTSYHGAEVHTAIAPNGGFSVLAALDEMEPHTLPSDADPGYWDSMVKTLESMWASRLADSLPAGASPHGTMHISTGDRFGNLVSATISQGGLFGSCLTVPGAGVILGHGMCRFDPRPGHSNSPGPRKRPLNNFAPLMLRMKDRDIAVGVRGGRRIVSVALQIAQRIIDLRASAYEAAIAPRIHTITGDPLEVSENFDRTMRAVLEARGYRTEVPEEVAGSAHGAEFFRADRSIRAGGTILAAGID